VLTVVDDRCGLAAGSLPSAGGLRGMREGAMLIGAGLTITSSDGGGTQVRLTVPHLPASRP
jgi:two-component system sensor histidine kinase UhpB